MEPWATFQLAKGTLKFSRGSEKVMGNIIGPAADFFRLRVIRIDETQEPNLDWRPDILYRTPPPDDLKERVLYALEAVDLVADDRVQTIAHFHSREDAYDALERVTEDLNEMTRSSFVARYLSSKDD